MLTYLGQVPAKRERLDISESCQRLLPMVRASMPKNRDQIRCVLCDLTMPRMDGWETMVALRKLAPGLPVILASGYCEAQALAGDHHERPQAFLNKPYELQELRATLIRVLENGL